MKILLTGGTGFIGSHTAVELIEANYTVELLDNLVNSKITVLDSIEKITNVKPTFHRIDLLDEEELDELFKNNQYDAVIHFAGLKAVAESVAKPLEYYRNNVIGTLNLLSVMKKYSVKKLIFSSSATVYGHQDVTKFTEDSPTGQNIMNPYGQTKYMIEQILKDFSNANPDYSITILRYFNPIGAHSSGLLGEDPNDIPNNLMPIIIKVYTGEIPELSIYGDDYDTPDGTGMRDFIHVVDLAKGHVSALEHLSEGISIYNLGTGKATSVMEMVKLFESISGQALPHKIAPHRPGDVAVCCADPGKAKKELGWETELSVEDAIRDTLNYINCQE
jgi:UDP-glucose 4-epimerase